MLSKLFFVVWLLFSAVVFAENNDQQQQQQLQIIFEQGMQFAANGDYEDAAEQFRKMLKDNPQLIRPRLELALVLYKNKDYIGAKHHFEQVLASKLPLAVHKNVNVFLVRIRQELPSLQLSVRLLSDDNPDRKTSVKSINLGGLEFKIEKPERQYGYQIIANGKIPISTKQGIFSKVTVDYSDYEGSRNSRIYLKGILGKHFKLAGHSSLTSEIGFHQFIYKGDGLYNGITSSLRYFKPINKANYLSLKLGAAQLNQKTNKRRSSWQYNLSTSWVYLPSSKSRLEFHPSFTKSVATNKAFSFNQPKRSKGLAYYKPSINLAYTQDFIKGWTVGVSAYFDRKFYKAKDRYSFFGDKKRKDNLQSYELTVLNRLIQIKNISPVLYIGWTKNDSNIKIYGFKRFYVNFGFTGKF